MSRISKKEIGRCFKLILKALETSVDLITTGDFMSRFCSNLGLPKQVQMAATHIARKAVELDLVPGRSPISVAAAAIYMASQASAEKRTQKGKTLFCCSGTRSWLLECKGAVCSNEHSVNFTPANACMCMFYCFQIQCKPGVICRYYGFRLL